MEVGEEESMEVDDHVETTFGNVREGDALSQLTEDLGHVIISVTGS